MRKLLRILSLLLTCAFLFSCQTISTISRDAQKPPDKPITVRMLAVNVGKGDCLIVQAGGKNYLVDTGPKAAYAQVSRALRALEITHLDGVFLTHCDADHTGGLASLAASSITVSAWYASAFYLDVTYEKHPLRLAAASRQQQATFLKGGDVVSISEDCYFQVLGPIMKIADSEDSNCLVMVLHTPDGRIFLAGDMEFPQEESLLQSPDVQIPHCEVLKVGNHGDNDATSPELVNAIRPQVAVISTSSLEKPGTPSKSVERILKRFRIETLVTEDAAGGVMVTLNSGTPAGYYIAFKQDDDLP